MTILVSGSSGMKSAVSLSGNLPKRRRREWDEIRTGEPLVPLRRTFVGKLVHPVRTRIVRSHCICKRFLMNELKAMECPTRKSQGKGPRRDRRIGDL